MYLCLVNQAGAILVHRHMPAAPDPVLKTIAPSRQDVVVWVEGLFTWSWLAALCAHAGLPFVLGHARSMTAIHGGKANNATIDSPNMAALLRGGMLPQADVYPAALRATRDLLRRRRHLARKRAARLAHMPHTNRPSNLPASGKKMADKANRAGVADRVADPAGHQRIEVELALIDDDAELRRDVERSRLNTATHHDANTLSLRQTVPGIGKLLSLVGLDALHDINRLPTVQDVVSDGRLGNCATASAGQRWGPAGPKLGQAQLTGAFSAAAVLCLRDQAPAPKDLARVENTQDNGNALTVLAQKLARAVDDRRKRPGAFDQEPFVPR